MVFSALLSGSWNLFFQMMNFVFVFLLLAQLPIPTWKMAKSLDSNHDDRVSLAEFHGDDAIFHHIDSDDDLFLTLEEIRVARKQCPEPPQLGDVVPKLTALALKTKEPISLHNRERPFALIFGTFT